MGGHTPAPLSMGGEISEPMDLDGLVDGPSLSLEDSESLMLDGFSSADETGKNRPVVLLDDSARKSGKGKRRDERVDDSHPRTKSKDGVDYFEELERRFATEGDE